MSCPLCTARPPSALRATITTATREREAAGEAERAWLALLLAGDVEPEFGYRELRRAIVSGEAAARRIRYAERDLERLAGVEAGE